MKILVLAAAFVASMALPTTTPETSYPEGASGEYVANGPSTEYPGGEWKTKEIMGKQPGPHVPEDEVPGCGDLSYPEPGGGPLTFEEIRKVAGRFRNITSVFAKTLLSSIDGAENWKPENPSEFLIGVKQIRETFDRFERLGEKAREFLNSAEERAKEHGFPLSKPCGRAVQKLYAEQPKTTLDVDLAMYQEAVTLDVKCIFNYVKELTGFINTLAHANEDMDELQIIGSFGAIQFYVGHITGAAHALDYSLEIAEALLEKKL